MNFIEAALTALRKADSPLDFRELWSLVVELGLDKQLASTGKTPWNTMGGRIRGVIRRSRPAWAEVRTRSSAGRRASGRLL